MTDDERYRNDKMDSGQRFQDHVVDLLFRRRGLVISQFVSREYQIRLGESLQGVEIKHDEKYSLTGNLWIEVGEKALPRAGEYAPSGVLRDDNTWLYVIGDYQTVFAFAKQNLILLYESKRYSLRENDRKTSVGFLFPRVDAERWAAFIERAEPSTTSTAVTASPAPVSPSSKSGEMLKASEIRW